ncbi:hypothetical protein CSUI_007608, partial [Cystoisospora suis]
MPLVGRVLSFKLALLIFCISLGYLVSASEAADPEPDSAPDTLVQDELSEETVGSEDFEEELDFVKPDESVLQSEEHEDGSSSEEESYEGDDLPEIASLESSRRRMQAFGYGGFYGYGMMFPGYMPYGGYMGGYMRPWSSYM